MRLRNGEHGYGAVTKTLHWLTVGLFAAQFVVGYTMETERELPEREEAAAERAEREDDERAEGAEDEREEAEVDCDPAGEELSGGDTSDQLEDRLDRLEERCERRQEARENRQDARADAAEDRQEGRADAAEERQDAAEEAAEDALGTAWDDLWSGDIGAGGLSRPELHILLGLAILAVGLVRLIWRRTTPLPPWDPRLTPTDQRLVHATEVTLLTLMFVVPASGLLLVLGARDLVALHVAAHVVFFVALGAHLLMVLGRRLLPRMLPGTHR